MPKASGSCGSDSLSNWARKIVPKQPTRRRRTYKNSTQNAAKLAIFSSKMTFFSGEGAQPSPQIPPQSGGGHPTPPVRLETRKARLFFIYYLYKKPERRNKNLITNSYMLHTQKYQLPQRRTGCGDKLLVRAISSRNEIDRMRYIYALVMCGLQNRPVADADQQIFLDPRTDVGCLVDENLQTPAADWRESWYLMSVLFSDKH